MQFQRGTESMDLFGFLINIVSTYFYKSIICYNKYNKTFQSGLVARHTLKKMYLGIKVKRNKT